MIPTHRYALAAAALAGLYLAGYIHGRTSTRDELTAWQSVATATQTRYRTLEKETADAQAAHVKVWTAARDASVRPVATECPKFVPSPEALRAMPGTDWKSPAARLLEYYTTPLAPLSEPTK
jgi:hypothetical protein